MMGTATKTVDPSPLVGLSCVTTQGQKSFGGDGEQYELEEVLGEGSYGSVYRCSRARDNAVFAVKVIDPLRLGFVGGSRAIMAAEEMAVREVQALRNLASHPGIISLEGAFVSAATRQIFIVTDFLPGSHLFSHVVQRINPLQEPEAAHVAAQVTDALSFCHSLGVVHRDLKLENILVASVNVSLVEERKAGPDGDSISWRTQELFTVKICDFGFAKSLQGYTTRTPVGTATYAAPEVKGESIACSNPEWQGDYDAFKADAYSVGVMIFVMICLNFPEKDGGPGSHRTHKLWSTLSSEVRSLIDGLLEVDPVKRLSVVQACSNSWITPLDPESPKRKGSKEKIIREADEAWESSRKSPKPKWRCQEDPVLPGVLALHRAVVHIQQERGMALWALAGTIGLDGISCWDQLRWHVQLTERRLHEAKCLLEKTATGHMQAHLDSVTSRLTKARQLQYSQAPPRSPSRSFLEVSGMEQSSSNLAGGEDAVFGIYNDAIKAIFEIIARCLEAAKPGSSEGRKAARRYRLFSAAAEQLSRERAFMCGCGIPVDRNGEPVNGMLPREKLQKLSEIIGSRKILLGTVVDDSETTNSYTVATSTGLLGGLIGGGEPALLSTADISELESLEARVLSQNPSHALPTEDWYRTLTRLLNEIHSRIAITLVDDMRLPELQLPPRIDEASRVNGQSERTERQLCKAPDRGSCGCRAGIKRLLQYVIDSL